jgi:hypothetical protein
MEIRQQAEVLRRAVEIRQQAKRRFGPETSRGDSAAGEAQIRSEDSLVDGSTRAGTVVAKL